MTPKHILLVRFSSIGDIIICTPVIRAVRKRYPEATLHFATKSQYASLLEENPHLDHLHLLDDSWDDFVNEILPFKFDILLDLHKNIRSKLLHRKLKPGRYYTYKKKNPEKWLLANFKWNRLDGKHILDRYFDMLHPLGCEYDGRGYEIHIPEDIQMGNLAAQEYACLSLGAKFKTKSLPYDQLEKLVDGLRLKLVLIGGEEERSLADRLYRAFPNKVKNLCGELSLLQSARVIERSKIVISHDTGMMHVACAFNKPLISIWGSTVPAFGFYPKFAEGVDVWNEVVERRDLSCRPCSKLGYESCPKGHFKCMNDHDMPQLADRINQWWR